MNRLFGRTSTGTLSTSDGLPPAGFLKTIVVTGTANGTARIQDASGGLDATFSVLANTTVAIPLGGVVFHGTLTLTLGANVSCYLEVGV